MDEEVGGLDAVEVSLAGLGPGVWCPARAYFRMSWGMCSKIPR